MSRATRHTTEQATGDDSEQTPDAYVEAIEEFTKRSQQEFLHSGHHYQGLVRFLRSPQAEDLTGFNFLSSYYLGEDGSIALTECPTAANLLNGPQLKPNCAQLIFLRGYPSAEVLKQLGAKYRIDPEYFRQHLMYLQNPAQPFYDVAALPSRCRNILRLKVTTIINRGTAITQRQVEDQRMESVSSVTKHQVALSKQNTIGESVVRKVSIHSERHLTIEQYITCCLVRKNGGWAILAWLDSGRDLPSGRTSEPWSGSVRRPNTYIPTIQHMHKAALGVASEHLEHVVAPQRARYAPTGSNNCQSLKFLPQQYGSGLKLSLARTDPLHALSEVFEHAAASESQFINLMQDSIEESLRDSEKTQTLSLTNLRYSKDLLDGHVADLQDVIAFIESSREVWKVNERNSDTNDPVKSDLLKDHKCLLRRAQNLAGRCLEGTQIIMNSAMLLESRKGIRQAEEVTRLTMLVLIFAPASFVCSLFGMNFVQFKNVGTAVAVFISSLLVLVGIPAFWAFRQGLRNGK